MNPSAFRIERLLAKVEAELVPPPRQVIIDGDDEADAKEKKRRRSLSEWPAIL